MAFLLNEGQAEVVEFVKARLRQLLMTKKMFAMTLSMQWCLLSKADLSKLFASANIFKKSRFEDQDF